MAAATIYLTGLFAIGVGITGKDIVSLHPFKFVLTTSVMLTLVLVTIFIIYHDANKKVAAQVVEAVQIVQSQLADPNFQLLESHMKWKKCEHPINCQEYTFPSIVWDNIRCMLEKQKALKWIGWMTKLCEKIVPFSLYLIMLLWTIVVTTIFCLSFPPDNSSGTSTTMPASTSVSTPYP